MNFANRIHLTNLPLKVVALICGYNAWVLYTPAITTTVTMNTPLCFYNIPSDYAVDAPETVTIYVAGTHAALRSIDYTAIALHVDAATLKPGPNTIVPYQQQMLLPLNVRLIRAHPSTVIATLNYAKDNSLLQQ